jgi:hypothetical protein
MTYQRLNDETTDDPSVCAVHGLLKYAKVTAILDAQTMRAASTPGTPRSLAQAQRCTTENNGSDPETWHIFIPSMGRMKTLRKKLRESGVLPPLLKQ